MFYSQHVLTKKGPLAKIWLAAHMQNKLTKAMVFATDVRKAVDSIISPEVPMALRLTSNLLLGVARILYRKTKYLLQESSDAMTRLKLTFRPGASPADPNQPAMRGGGSGTRAAAPTTATYNAVTLQPSVDTLIAPNLDLDLLPARPATNPTSFLAADRDITIDEFAGGLMGGMLDAFALDPELSRQDDLPADLGEPLLFTPSERPGRNTPQSSSLRSDPSVERMRAAPAEGARLDTPILSAGKDASGQPRQKFSVTGAGSGAAPSDPESARAATGAPAELEPMDIGDDLPLEPEAAPSPEAPSIALKTPTSPTRPAPGSSGPDAPLPDRLSTGPSGERLMPRLSTGTDDLQLAEGDTPLAAEPGTPLPPTEEATAVPPAPGTPAPGESPGPAAGATDGTPAPGTPAPEAAVTPVPTAPVEPGTPGPSAPTGVLAAPGTPAPAGSPEGLGAPGTPATPAGAPFTPITPAPDDSPRSDTGRTDGRRESAAWEPPATPGTPDTPASERREYRKRKAHVLTDVGATEMSNMDFRACLNDTSDLLRGPRPPVRRRIDSDVRYADILGRPIVTLAPALRELFEQSFRYEDRVGSPMTDADLGGEEEEEQEEPGKKQAEVEEEEEEADAQQKDTTTDNLPKPSTPEGPRTPQPPQLPEDSGVPQPSATGEDVVEGVAEEAAAPTPVPEPVEGSPKATDLEKLPEAGKAGATTSLEATPAGFRRDEDDGDLPMASPGTVGGTPAREPPAAIPDPEPPIFELGSPAPPGPEAMPVEGEASEAISGLGAPSSADVGGGTTDDIGGGAGRELEVESTPMDGPKLAEVAATRAQVDRAVADELTEATVSARTGKMQEYILAHLGDGDKMSYTARLIRERPMTRRTAARTFYELLNLSSKKAVKLEQTEAYGAISVAPVQPAFDALAASVRTETEEAQ